MQSPRLNEASVQVMPTGTRQRAATARVGLKVNLPQISLLVAVTLFVGGMVGLERSVLPLVAQSDFGIASHAAILTFVATFGISKALVNLLAGTISDRLGRRACLIAGWVIGIPVPLIIMFAPDWGWILGANVLLGVNQALTWSMAVNMKMDLAGSHERGLAMGLNEFAGYTGLALVASLTGFIAEQYGLRPVPFYLGVGFAIAGLILSLLIRDTRVVRDAQASAIAHSAGQRPDNARFAQVFRRASWTDRRLSAASLAGLITNFKDGMLWGLLPISLASQGLRIWEIGLVVAVYPAVWGVAQLVAGPLSDRVSRRVLIICGLAVQGGAVAGFVIADSLAGSLFAATLVGIGTALVYPTLQAFVSDVAAHSWRAAALGVYRFWRDLGYALGALGAGAVADALGIFPAFTLFAVAIALASIVFAVRSRDHAARTVIRLRPDQAHIEAKDALD